MVNSETQEGRLNQSILKMKWIKKGLFPLFAVFLLFRSFELVKQVLNSQNAYSFSEEVLITLLLIVFITGVFALPGFAYPTSRLIPEKYYKIKNPNRLKIVYHVLGVKYFRIFLMVFFWGLKKNRLKYFNGKRSGIQNLVYQSNQSEFGHLMAFVSIFLVGVLLIFYSQFQIFLLLFILNIFVNLYPIILQRHHRMRVQKLTQS